MSNLSQLLLTQQQHINDLLAGVFANAHNNDLNNDHTPPMLQKAMHYAVLNGGKRIRPLLVYATGIGFAADENSKYALNITGTAFELVHAYSLVHDDLPAMDDADLRHGHPSCHKQFGEATAVLVGDALQSLAFEVLTSKLPGVIPAEKIVVILTLLAQAIGPKGMVAGQFRDIMAEKNQISLPELELLYRQKTGALLKASIQAGAIIGSHKAEQYEKISANLNRFADALGLAFQIRDDIIDIESSTETLGKQQGADISRQKPTYTALLGLTEAKRQADELKDEALAMLDIIENELRGDFSLLRELAEFVVAREM